MYHLILNNGTSFRPVVRTGRGVTNDITSLPLKNPQLVGSVANGLNSSGSFCTTSSIVVDHRRINVHRLLSPSPSRRSSWVPARRGINIPRNTLLILSTLRENV